MVTQSYQVSVPYTEQVQQNYTVQVPMPIQASSQFDSKPGYYNQNYTLPTDAAKLGKLRDRNKRLYRRLAPTQEWIENNYYLLPLERQTADLVAVNRFWRDLANHKKGPFLSPYFTDAHRSFTEMMFAMAVLDLPLTATDGKAVYKDRTMTYTAAGPTIALHQQVRGVNLEEGNTKILISETSINKTTATASKKASVTTTSSPKASFLIRSTVAKWLSVTRPRHRSRLSC